MGKAVNVLVMVAALVVTYEFGREAGARKMFFTCMEAMAEQKMKEEKDAQD